MSDRMKESLSALMDGEANELELQRVLRDSTDPMLRTTWARYNRVSRILREGRDAHIAQLDVSTGVSEAIAAEMLETVEDPASTGWRAVLRPVASFAVAASVFAAVLVGGQLYGLVGLERGPDQGFAAGVSPVGLVNTMGGSAVQANFSAGAEPRAQRRERQANYNQLARQRLQRYILPHAEQAALNAPRGMMPYARVTAERMQEQ